MDKQLFDDAIGEVPPSTVDVDAAIARGRRAAWTRRVANPMVAIAAGVVLVAGGAVALTMPDGGSDDPVTAAQVQPTDQTTEADQSGSAVQACATPSGNSDSTAGAEPPEPASADALELTEALAAALASRGLLVDATLTGDKPLEFVHLYAEADALGACMSYTATAVVNQTGRLTVSVGALPADVPSELPCKDGVAGCQITSSGTVLTSAPEGGVQVYVAKDDRTVVSLLAESLEAGASPPLTAEQLSEIGRDPAMTVK